VTDVVVEEKRNFNILEENPTVNFQFWEAFPPATHLLG
jgi:hypothetical protein